MENLKKLIETRNLIKKLEAEIEGLMPIAVMEAMEVLADRRDKKQIVYEDNHGKIVLVFKKIFLNPQNDMKLSRIDADIVAAVAKCYLDNKQELSWAEHEVSKHKDAIADMDNLKQRLTTNDYIIRLRSEFSKYREETVSLNPTLSVFI